MGEHKKELWLYMFTVNREIEVDQTTEAEVNGEKVKVTKKVKEQKPIVFALKRPNRRMYEQADMFFGVQLSEGIRAGLLTKALLLKRYRNDGGALSDVDAKYFYELTTTLANLEDEHQRLLINVEGVTSEEKIAKADIIVRKKMDVLKALQSLETVNQALFAHTAEAKAQVQLNNWWIVYLAYWDKNGNGEFEEFFPGETFDKKMELWDTFDETREAYVVEALARFSLLIGLWNAGAQSKDDFAQGEKDYGTIAAEVIATQTNEDKQPTQEIAEPTKAVAT